MHQFNSGYLPAFEQMLDPVKYLNKKKFQAPAALLSPACFLSSSLPSPFSFVLRVWLSYFLYRANPLFFSLSLFRYCLLPSSWGSEQVLKSGIGDRPLSDHNNQGPEL